jgi:hypothetical protein
MMPLSVMPMCSGQISVQPLVRAECVQPRHAGQFGLALASRRENAQKRREVIFDMENICAAVAAIDNVEAQAPWRPSLKTRDDQAVAASAPRTPREIYADPRVDALAGKLLIEYANG